MFDSFGNRVKIRATLATQAKGLAGKIGVVYGQTTPSMMDVEVVGTPKEDFAVNVYFEDMKTAYWFDADLLETIDNGAGSTVALDGVNKKWTKGQDGEWIEEDTSSATTPAPIKTYPTTDKKWWEFWKWG